MILVYISFAIYAILIFIIMKIKKPSYGIQTLTGSFGAGKTKNVFLESMYKKHKKKDTIIIANCPYDFVDIVFNSERDLKILLEYIVKFMIDTNDFNNLSRNFRNIILIIDEAHLYIDSRDFKTNFDKNGKISFTQCRKRNLDIYIVNQHFSQGDKRTRILSKYIRKYYNFLNFYKFYVDYELLKDDSTDLKDQTVAQKIGGGIIFGFILPDWLQKYWYPNYKNFSSQKYLSKFVVGFDDRFHLSYEEFLNKIL